MQTYTPDYTTLREEMGFSWRVSGNIYLLFELTGLPMREFFLDPQVAIELYTTGREKLHSVLGPDIPVPRVTTPPVSYGHVNTLGSELFFPEGGEVAHNHPCETIDHAIELACKDVDFASAGMSPFYLDYHKKMQQAFPDEKVGFAFGLEGPLTTAYSLRGDGLFYDLMDCPDKICTLLDALVDSTLAFHKFMCEVNDLPPFRDDAGGMCDDIASNVPPRLFDDLVLPYWDKWYRGVTSGMRYAHVEDLRPDHMPCLEKTNWYRYDPSISPKLTPRIVGQGTRVPFAWRLGSFHYRDMDTTDVRNFVFDAVAEGANEVFTYGPDSLADAANIDKMHTFIDACRQVDDLLDKGATRDDIAQCIINK